MGSSRVPETIPPFNNYINSTDDNLQAISSGVIHNWERLGLSSVNASDWHDQRTYWRDTLYPKYSSPATSTSLVKAEVKAFIIEFRKFANPLLDIMAASPNAGTDDEIMFNFKIGRAPAHHATDPIAGTVVYDAQPLGGGDFKFKCRTAADSSRASLAAGADSVQLGYMVQEKSSGPTPPAPADDNMPNPNQTGMTKDIFTKATFTFHAEAENVGKTMIVFARWFNTKHPELAGPWSAVRAVVIA